MKRRDWIRLYRRMIDSPEILELEDAEFRLIVSIWCLADDEEHPGLVPFSVRAIQRRCLPHHDEQTVAAMIDRLVALDLLRPAPDGRGYVVPRWLEHQHRYPSWAPNAQRERRLRRRAAHNHDSNSQPDTQPCDQLVIDARSSDDQAMIKRFNVSCHDTSRSMVESHVDRRVDRSSEPLGNPNVDYPMDSEHPVEWAQNPRDDADSNAESGDVRDQAMIKRLSSDDQGKNKNKKKKKKDIVYMAPDADAPAQPRVDPLFEAVVECCYGQPYGQVQLTRSERGRVNDTVKQLREIGASPDDVRTRATLYRQRWPHIDLTPSALVKHWSSLTLPLPSPPAPARAGPTVRRTALDIALETLRHFEREEGAA